MAARNCEPGFTFLHGTLEVSIIEARKVEGTTAGRFLKKLERAVTASTDGVDPYVSVKLGFNKIMQTAVMENCNNPEWNETATFDVADEIESLDFRLKAAKRTGALALISKVQHLSMLSLPAELIAEKKVIDDWFDLTSFIKEKKEDEAEDGDRSDSDSSSDDEAKAKARDKKKPGELGSIHVRVVYTPVGEAGELAKVTVPNAYFPARKGIDVKLYQDADQHPGFLPTIPFRPGYQHGRCWRDILTNILEATDLIYITGWAVWPELHMVRTDFEGDELLASAGTLEEVLKRKAAEGGLLIHAFLSRLLLMLRGGCRMSHPRFSC